MNLTAKKKKRTIKYQLIFWFCFVLSGFIDTGDKWQHITHNTFDGNSGELKKPNWILIFFFFHKVNIRTKQKKNKQNKNNFITSSFAFTLRKKTAAETFIARSSSQFSKHTKRHTRIWMHKLCDQSSDFCCKTNTSTWIFMLTIWIW